MKIAITGTVGSGKSRVAAMLSAVIQVQSLDTDQVCRDLLQRGNQGWSELQLRWGEKFFDSEGNLDRTLLRDAVFSEETIRLELEEILHPMVRDAIDSYNDNEYNHCGNLLVEVPLLFEKGWETDFDYTISVYASVQCCIARTTIRDNVPHNQAESILALQLSPEEKATRADTVIDNSGLWAATVLQVSCLGRNILCVDKDSGSTV